MVVQTRRGSVGLLIDGWLIIRNYSRESNGTSEASCVGVERSVELDGAAGAAERSWLDGSTRLRRRDGVVRPWKESVIAA